MTNAEIMDLARDLTDTRNDEYISSSYLWTLINVAHKQIYMKAVMAAEDYNLSTTTWSTSSGTDSYGYMGNVHQIRRIEVINATGPTQSREDVVEVLPRDLNEIRKNYFKQYSVQGDNIVFYPSLTDSTSVRMYFVPKPSTLSASTGQPMIEPEYHHLISYYAGLHIKTREDSNRSSLEADYRDLLDQFIQNVESRQAQRSRHIIDFETYDQ